MRRRLSVDCEGAAIAASLDEGAGDTALLIVSGGNELRSGAHHGQASLAARIAARRHPVLRFDRRGVGDSAGDNGEFLASGPDIAAAAEALRRECPMVRRIVGFGNCDAASALALFGPEAGLAGYVLANPWVIEEESEDAPALPPPAAIRSRYLQRLKDPRALLDLVTGKVDLGKLAKGLRAAAGPAETTALAERLAGALQALDAPATILLAETDRTAQVFAEAWGSEAYAAARALPNLTLQTRATSSHSFAGPGDADWLEERIAEALESRSEQCP